MKQNKYTNATKEQTAAIEQQAEYAVAATIITATAAASVISERIKTIPNRFNMSSV